MHKACAEMRINMKKKLVAALLISTMVLTSISGCGSNDEQNSAPVQTEETASVEETTQTVSTEETKTTSETDTEEQKGSEYSLDKDFTLNTVDEEGNPCDVQTSLDYTITDDGNTKTYVIDLTYTQEDPKPFLVKITAFDTAKLNIIKKFDDSIGETTEGTIKIDDTSYDYTAIVEQETDENGVVTKETLTLTVDEGYDNLGLWIVAYQDKTHLGDEKRFEIK